MRALRLSSSLLLAAVAGALAAAPVADAAPAPSATINVCDSPGSPNTLGVRAQMPGSRRGDELSVTIKPEWWSRQRRQWLATEGNLAVEVPLGGGEVRSSQSGYSFQFSPPESGRRYALRAEVVFQWRRGGRVVRSASAVTGAGMADVRESDPAGFSAATCILR